MAAGAHLSKDFFDLIKSIGESKSKQVRVECGARAHDVGGEGYALPPSPTPRHLALSASGLAY